MKNRILPLSAIVVDQLMTCLYETTSLTHFLRKPNYYGEIFDRIPSTTPGAEPPRDAKDSGSARPHSTHLETSSSNRP